MANDRFPKLGDAAPKAAATGRDMQKVSERLRDLISSLKTEKERLADVRSGVTPGAFPIPAEVAGAATDLEKKRLAAELSLAHEAIEHSNAERERLRERLAEIERENRRICDEYVTVQAQSSEMAQLYVALDRLHSALAPADVLGALQEIVINVIGSEEFAVLEGREGALALVRAFGVDPGRLRSVRAGAGAIGRAAASGRLYVAGRDGEPDPADGDLSACVPLRVGDRVWGVLAIFRLLGHKPSFTDSDQAVFDLLAAHAGLALHLRARAAAG
jgi:GAF domain-containing protein